MFIHFLGKKSLRSPVPLSKSENQEKWGISGCSQGKSRLASSEFALANGTYKEWEEPTIRQSGELNESEKALLGLVDQKYVE